MLLQDWRIEAIYELFSQAKVRVAAACVLGVNMCGWMWGTLKAGIVLVVMLDPI